MPLVAMRQLLDEAAKGGYGVGAFNVNNMGQIQAIMKPRAKPSRPSSCRQAAAPAAIRKTSSSIT
jgi:fructose/tagatose bisphosphate aldolase